MWRLHRAVTQASFPPSVEDWSSFQDEINSVAAAKAAQTDLRARPVQQLSADGRVLATFPSISAASRAAKVTSVMINAVLRGKRAEAGGFGWRNAVSSTLNRIEAAQQRREEARRREEEEGGGGRRAGRRRRRARSGSRGGGSCTRRAARTAAGRGCGTTRWRA